MNSVSSDLFAAYGQYAKKTGCSVLQLRVLEALYRQPPCSQTALAGRLELSKQTLNLTVLSMADAGLLALQRDEKDGRRKLVGLTAGGREAAKALLAFLRQEERQEANGSHTHILPDGSVLTHTHTESGDHAHGDAAGAHGHTHTNTKEVLDRLARAIGHLEKVRRMVEDGADCSEVLIQLSAVRSAVNSTGKLILKDHIGHCLVDAVERGDLKTVEELNRAIDRFIK